jgi:CCR4-NOT transcription complex subunit 1
MVMSQPFPPQTEARVFPPEVEEFANNYFQKIYTGQMSIEEIVALLKRFKASKDMR